MGEIKYGAPKPKPVPAVVTISDGRAKQQLIRARTWVKRFYEDETPVTAERAYTAALRVETVCKLYVGGRMTVKGSHGQSYFEGVLSPKK